ncbi:exodeoxyribonuclease III [Pantoea sp. Aalb]|uniref:exodeoxyribonuclease III n=1 Tax=Pantoea sp. Aalb TaxID=2576762 RepID=UPI0013216EB8|nr:exodeoxyribonuclease III [Pantoea sp. Aalb]MXP67382.1 exodeoxyribonuclease III [Pantoea sp. Aalb]
MKFVSFNVNGLRARKHQLEALIKKHEPDVIGLQETKVHNDMFPLEELKKLNYNIYYHGQKAHYGVALFTRKSPITVCYNFPEDEKNVQCRVIIADISSPIGNIKVLNAYFPQGGNRNDSIKFGAKKTFFYNLQNYLEKNISINSPIIIMGDMNISTSDLDIGIGEKNRTRWLNIGKCSFLPEEREWMKNLFSLGLVDTWREKNPKINDCFSWFDYRSKGFNDNRGLRIDLLLANKYLASYCIESGIDYDIRSMKKPSDHAPVWSTFKFI